MTLANDAVVAVAAVCAVAAVVEGAVATPSAA